MPPEVKVRNIDESTLQRIKARAESEGRSAESFLRSIITEAVADAAMTTSDWIDAGFQQVDEIEPGRIYDAWGDHRHFRIFIGRGVVSSNTIRWHSRIDELVQMGENRVWTSPVGIPDRHFGETAADALRDAVRWLASWGGFDAIGRTRRDAEAAKQMHPGLRRIADAIDNTFDEAKASWRDETRASWTTEKLDFFISRDGQSILLMTYHAGTPKLAFLQRRFQMVTDVAKQLVRVMREQMAGDGQRVPARTRS
jgi:plasmid stability protein